MTVVPVDSRGGLLSAVHTITAAELRACFTTPVTVFAAPGAGLMYAPTSLSLRYIFNTTPYNSGANGADITFGAPGIATNLCVIGNLGALIDQLADVASIFPLRDLSTQVPGDLLNKPLLFSADTSNPTTGDGTLRVSMLYSLLAL